MVRCNPTYDFSNRFEFGLNVILDALTRSIPDDGGDRLTVDRSVPRRKNPLWKPTGYRHAFPRTCVTDGSDRMPHYLSTRTRTTAITKTL
jgi:hypothetical protein